MSLFDRDSALCRLDRTGVLRDPPAELLAVLPLAQTVAARSDGAFDVTVQPLWQAFAEAQQKGRLPTPEEVAAARSRVDWRALEVGPSIRSAYRPFADGVVECDRGREAWRAGRCVDEGDVRGRAEVGLVAAQEWQVDALLVDKQGRLFETPGLASLMAST